MALIISDQVWLILIPTVASTIGSVLTYLTKNKVADNTVKTETTLNTATKVEGLVNGNFSKLSEELKEYHAKNIGLEAQVALLVANMSKMDLVKEQALKDKVNEAAVEHLREISSLKEQLVKAKMSPPEKQ